MTRAWGIVATLVLVPVSLTGCDVFGAVFGRDGFDPAPAGGPEPSPGPTPSPSPGDTTFTTTPGVGCTEAFATGCGAQLKALDDGACFLRREQAHSFPRCDEELKKHFDEYKRLEGDKRALNELVLDGATGTCLTGLRLLASQPEPACPMPMPPATSDINAGDSFNILTLGDWGPTPAGAIVRGENDCNLVPRDVLRDSMFMFVKDKAPGLCQADTWWHNNNAQQLVADAMASHSIDAKPIAVLSLGDNFYMGGIPTPHNLGVHDDFGVTEQYAFEQSWKDVYLKNKNGGNLSIPWLSIMGNHDYGGAGCQADWQLQIDYSKKDEYWRMPWQYFKQRVQADSYTLDIFMLEVNSDDFFLDTPQNGICLQDLCRYTQGGAAGDPERCKSRVRAKEAEMLKWLELELKFSVDSGTRWRVLVGHFPNGPATEKVLELGAKYGAVLYVAGHTHAQHFFHKNSAGGNQHMALLVSGAGGGYMQEGDGDFYGFGNLAFSRDKIEVTIIDADGQIRKDPDGESKHDIAYEEPKAMLTAAILEARHVFL